jgi:DNA helicase II / ATP-dependent DNA helicase PcrA
MAADSDPLAELLQMSAPPRAGEHWTRFVELASDLRATHWPADLEGGRVWMSRTSTGSTTMPKPAAPT